MISIHAPTRGATFSAALRRSKPLNFNPRSHEGSDNIFYADKPSELYFNPRSHEGSDVYLQITCKLPIISIHAPTRGATKVIDYNAQRLANFNPRSHEGSDSGYYHQGDRSCISIHAPTRGATRCDLWRWLLCSYFNPRSHEGSDNTWSISTLYRPNFNPRSHEGSDTNK